jgi:hypothetical protein
MRTQSKRWLFVGYGRLGFIWHDVINDRYVISDQYGPAGEDMGPGGSRGPVMSAADGRLKSNRTTR